MRSSWRFPALIDCSQVTATFEMGGVKKQDMHVSYRVNRIVVTWRRTRIVERMEGSVKVRDRQEKQYNQIIPIPEGTKVGSHVYYCINVFLLMFSLV